MSQYLPYSNFTWLSMDEIENVDIHNIMDNANEDHILEVDLEYPENIHNKHNDFPFCVENITPSPEKMQKKILIAILYIYFKIMKQV